jgi:hypothetical protein
VLLPGKRINLTKVIHGSRCAVRVQVDAVIPDEDPSEPVIEPAMVRWLDELQRLVDAGEVDKLETMPGIGDVYVRKSA